MTLNGWTNGAVAAVVMAASSFMAGPAVAEVKIGLNVPLTGFAASDGCPSSEHLAQNGA